MESRGLSTRVRPGFSSQTLRRSTDGVTRFVLRLSGKLTVLSLRSCSFVRKNTEDFAPAISSALSDFGPIAPSETGYSLAPEKNRITGVTSVRLGVSRKLPAEIDE